MSVWITEFLGWRGQSISGSIVDGEVNLRLLSWKTASQFEGPDLRLVIYVVMDRFSSGQKFTLIEL